MHVQYIVYNAPSLDSRRGLFSLTPILLPAITNLPANLLFKQLLLTQSTDAEAIILSHLLAKIKPMQSKEARNNQDKVTLISLNKEKTLTDDESRADCLIITSNRSSSPKTTALLSRYSGHSVLVSRSIRIPCTNAVIRLIY